MNSSFGKVLNFSFTVLALGFAVLALGFAAYALKPLIGSYLPSMTSWGTPKPILVASISFDHGQNELRAKEKYGSGTFDVTGIASDFEMDRIDGNVLNIIMGDGSSNIALYAKLPGGRVGQVAQINKGNLITVTCKDYGIYGITPSFSECKNPRLYPLNGKSADLVYDQLLAANNPYLNASPSAAKAPSAPTPPAAAAKVDGNVSLPTFAPNEAYSSARQKLLAAGWQPYRSKDASECFGDDPRCKDRPETLSCAGTGRAPCIFTWSRNGKIAVVDTVGEDTTVVSSSIDDSNTIK